MAYNLHSRVAKLEAGHKPDDLLDQLSDEALLEYNAYLSAKLLWLDAKKILCDPESTPAQKEKAAAVAKKEPELPTKYKGISQALSRQTSDEIKNLSDEELNQYVADKDRRLERLWESKN